mgnify:CR=1 FL=1
MFFYAYCKSFPAFTENESNILLPDDILLNTGDAFWLDRKGDARNLTLKWDIISEAQINITFEAGKNLFSYPYSVSKNINDIVNQKDLKEFFTDQYTIYNERDILTSTGQMIRPDRLAIKDNQATIIDYKTGLPNPKYEQQLEIYATHLKEMGYQISNKILERSVASSFLPYSK